MVKVYKVILDVNEYQALSPDTEGEHCTSIDFDGTSKLDGWVAPPVFSLYPKRKTGDFWAYWGSMGTMAITPQAVQKLSNILEIAGELLPLPFGEETFYLVNVLECINCLDTDKSVWFNNSRKIGTPQKYVFHPSRFTTTLFKIPETCLGEILALELEGDPYAEFKAFVEAKKMKGIRFKEIWSGSPSAE